MGLFFNNQDIANVSVTEKAVLYSRSRFSCELSEIRAAKPDGARLLREAPAAFGRLCVETRRLAGGGSPAYQPPSGGCVLKRLPEGKAGRLTGPAAFGRLCVETPAMVQAFNEGKTQPPSGGCVLKPERSTRVGGCTVQPPSGGCVLKHRLPFRRFLDWRQPPSGGCVLKPLLLL